MEGERVTALNVSMGRLTLLRRCSTSVDGHMDSTWDPVVDLQPADAVESAALSSPSGDLSARLRWSAGEGPQGASASAASPEVVSVSFGCVSLVYPPGFFSRLAPFLGAVLPPGYAHKPSEHATGAGASPAEGDSPSDVKSTIVGAPALDRPASSGEERGAGHTRSAPAWLRGGTALGASIISLHVALLSGEEAGEVAVVMALSRLSAHLGPVRTAARAGSLVDNLYRICTGPVPSHGLRVSAGGILWGIAVPWEYRGASASRPVDAGDEEEDLPAGSRPISSAFGVQALLAVSESGAEGGSPTLGGTGLAGSAEAGELEPEEGASPGVSLGWVLRVAVEPIHVRLSRVHLAALSAVVSAMLHEVRVLDDSFGRPTLGGAPEATTGPEGAPRYVWEGPPEDAASWVERVCVDVQGLWCVVATGAVPPLAEQPAAPRDAHVVVQCRQVELRVQGPSAGTTPEQPVLDESVVARHYLRKYVVEDAVGGHMPPRPSHALGFCTSHIFQGSQTSLG